MGKHERPATVRFLQEVAAGRSTALEVGLGGNRRSCDGAVWNSGGPGQLSGTDLLLVQTKRFLSTSVLGQAYFSTYLAEAAGARKARCIALVGTPCPMLEDLASRAPFAERVEVVVRPDLFEAGKYSGAPAWSRGAVEQWLDGRPAEQKTPLYPKGEGGAWSYDRACAVLEEHGQWTIINTQRKLGMSVLGRAFCARELLSHRTGPGARSLVLVRATANDLQGFAKRCGLSVLEVPERETADRTLLRG